MKHCQTCNCDEHKTSHQHVWGHWVEGTSSRIRRCTVSVQREYTWSRCGTVDGQQFIRK